MELLRVENLSKTYGKGEAAVRALRDVSFSMERGEFAAVVGESGSGKSTLLNCIGGLDAPTGGKAYLDGEDLFSMTENKRTIFRRQNPVALHCGNPLRPDLHIRHAENGGHEKHSQENADPCHEALLPVHPSGNFHQVQITLHRLTPPISRTPSDTFMTRSTEAVRFIL